MKRLVLIDGNSLIHRAYHALPPLNAPDGTPVNAVYGFTSMLLRVLQELKPEYIALTFDLPGPTFRHAQYVAYKANRPKADSDLVPQFQKVRDIVRAFNIPIFEVEGYEADDLVGTLARQANELNETKKEFKEDPLSTIIVSGDMDTLQLVNDHTKVFTPKKGISDTILYNETQVKERYGFEPEKLIDYKGLKGDTSDNIPGVPGIGDKTAAQLIQQYGNLEGVLENIPFLKGKVQENIRENAEQAKLSKTLATIDRFAPITLHLEDTQTHDFDRPTVLKAFQELGFRSLVTRLNEVFPTNSEERRETSEHLVGEVITDGEDMRGDYRILDSVEEVSALVKKIADEGVFALDTETSDLRPIESELVGISIAYRSGEGFYIPYDPKTLAVVKPILEDPKIKKIGHNMKYDYLVLQNYDVTVQGMYFDTLLAAWLVSPGGLTSIGLKNLVYQELGITMTDISELIGKGKKQISMAEVDSKAVAEYACADADMAFRLKQVLEKKLRQANVYTVFEKYEMPLIPVLAIMERHGVLIDEAFLAKMSKELEKDIQGCTKAIFDSIGHEFNLNSPKQLADVLFSELQLPTQFKTKTGFSTDEATLNALKDAHPAITYLLKYRELFKLKNTYIDALPQLVSKKDGRVHTSFNQTGASSGRLSSSDPNLQNIPIKTELGAKIRQAFVADKGHCLVALDYSQIELRILAHLSQDPLLVKAFKENQDIHTVTASAIYGIEQDKVTKDMRRTGKTVNFALMYGISAFGLSQQLSIPRAEAQAFIERYFVTYARVKKFFDELLQKAYQDGYVETLSGRKRFIPELQSHIPNIRRAGERMALNLPMQGTNADIIKLAMIQIDRYLKAQNLQSKMILQVHDELVFEMPEAEIAKAIPQIAHFMTQAMKLSVPIIVEVKKGDNWGEMEKLSLD